ncbi:MAG: TrmH family RNA methyltransferase, partial [Mycobacteriales bacterium]
EELIAAARRVLVLEAMNNPTNVGGVFRSAAALGMDAVLLDPFCYDPLYRRAVRVSMGAVLAVPYARVTPWPQGLDRLRAAGFRLWALCPAPTGRPLPELGVAAADRVALLLGAEGPGLSAAALAASDEQVRIPMAPGADSLNAAAAAAVACYAVGGAAAPYIRA